MQDVRGDMRPVVAMVGRTLFEIQNGLTDIKYNKRTNAQQKLLEALVDFSYGGDNATYLLQELEQFKDEPVGYGRVQYFFNRLFGFLEHLIIFEKDGIDGLNHLLNDTVTRLRTPDPSLEEERIMSHKLNHLLLNLIYLCPHIVKSVEIKIKPGVETREETEKFWKRFGSCGMHRSAYGDLLRLHLDRCGVEHNRDLVFPLPYWFTTGTHGSGERAAAGVSREDVSFSFIYERGGGGEMTPTIKVAIKRPIICFEYTYFTIDEIESIKLSGRTDFTPLVSRGFRDHEEPEKLVKRTDYLAHYLYFRDFGRYVGWRNREQMGKMSDEEWKRIAENLLEPNVFSNLCPYKKIGWIDLCFLVDYGDEVLYELTGISLPCDDYHISAGILLLKIFRGDEGILSHTKIYRGDEIIRRLLEIPVAERHF